MLATAVATVAAVLGYSAFFYHYADFVAPVAGAVGRVRGRRRWPARFARGRRCAGPDRLLRGVLVLAVAASRRASCPGCARRAIYPDRALIPAGSCVVSDQISLTIAANRFTAARPGCPAVLDGLARRWCSATGSASRAARPRRPAVVAAWQSILSRADYVWLSPNNARRIPWTPELTSWFAANFQPLQVHGQARRLGQVYERIAGG